MTRVINKTSDASRRAALDERIDLCRATLADSALAHERQPTSETKTQIERGMADLAAARLALEMFELALEASKREATVEEVQATVQQVTALRHRIEALHTITVASASKIIAAIEALGPQYAKLIVDLAETRELTTAAVRLSGGAKAVQRVLGQGRHLDGHAQLAASVGLAIASAGFGTVGPSLAPAVVVIPPSGYFTVEDIAIALDRLHALRLEAIEQASAPVANEETLA